MRASTSASAWISLCRQASARSPSSALHLTQRLAALAFGLGRDQIGEAFHRGEIELAVLEGAPGEFAGLGRAQALEARRRRCKHRGDHGAAAVQLQLGDVLAGLAMRAPGNHSASASSMVSLVAGSRTRASAAARGEGILPVSAFSAAPARGPEMRMTAIAAGGRPEERAKMVSRARTSRRS